MSLSLFQKAVLYVKETQDVGIFSSMINSVANTAFYGSLLFYIMFPFVGVLLGVLAIINGYQLSISTNKNFDQWSRFITSVLATVIGGVSLFGGAISAAMGITFLAGPVFFLSSIAIGFVHQLIMLGINCYRAYESEKNSNQRMHYIQAALNNLFILGLLTSIMGAIIFALLTPVAPLVGGIFALTVVALTIANATWRLMPHNWKLFIKEQLSLGKPEQVVIYRPDVEPSIKHGTDSTPEAMNHRIFAPLDYSAKVRQLDYQAGVDFLNKSIDKKVSALAPQIDSVKDKNDQKIRVMYDLRDALENHKCPTKAKLLETYPLAFQSFWAEKGEVEQLVDAVIMVTSQPKPPALVSDLTDIPFSLGDVGFIYKK